MAKKPNKKNKLPPFAAITFEMLESAAFMALTPNAAKALPYFMRAFGKAKGSQGRNFDGTFDFTYSEAAEHGFARRTFARVIDDLHAKGFIDIAEQGGRRSQGMTNTKYRLSERWRSYGMVKFDRVTADIRSMHIVPPRYPSEPPKKNGTDSTL